MADYSPDPPLSKSALKRLEVEEQQRKAEREARIDAFYEQARKILDGGSVLAARELHASIVAQNQPNSNEIWAAIQKIVFEDQDYHENPYGRLSKRT